MPDWLDTLIQQMSDSSANGDSPADAVPSEDLSGGSSVFNPGKDSQTAADLFSAVFGNSGSGSSDAQSAPETQTAAKPYEPFESGFTPVDTQVTKDNGPSIWATLAKNAGIKTGTDGSVDWSDPKTITSMMKIIGAGGSIINALMNRGVPQNYKSASQLAGSLQGPNWNWTPQQQAAFNAFTAKPMGGSATHQLMPAALMPNPIVPGKGYADGGTVTPFSSASPSAAAYPGMALPAPAPTTMPAPALPPVASPGTPTTPPIRGGGHPPMPARQPNPNGVQGGVLGSAFGFGQMPLAQQRQTIMQNAPAGAKFSLSPNGAFTQDYSGVKVPMGSFGSNGSYTTAGGQTVGADRVAQIQATNNGLSNLMSAYRSTYGNDHPMSMAAFGSIPDAVGTWTPDQINQWVTSHGPAFARGGMVRGYAGGGALGHVMSNGGGQADDVPARLSGGEYVMDADTVSSLGDGNNAAGAQKLDEMRQSIRRHKRSAPADKIPPKAKEPQQYMKKGGK